MATNAPSMGARTRAPSVNTPSLSRFDSPGALLREIEQACQMHSIGEARFGRLALGDSNLVLDLRNGRTPRPATCTKVAALIATLAGEGTYKHQRRAVKPLPRRHSAFGLTDRELDYRASMRAGSKALLAAIFSAREA